jgi:hypothetical protein
VLERLLSAMTPQSCCASLLVVDERRSPMRSLVGATIFMLPTSAFVPQAVGFVGLGTGELIYGAVRVRLTS